jgi:hypothetical protein
MGKNRLEAFSDGVIAILITIMVLELKGPHGAELDALLPVLSVLGTSESTGSSSTQVPAIRLCPLPYSSASIG